MSEEKPDSPYDSIVKEIVEKLRDINQLSLELPPKMRLEVYESAKRHFYIGQCLTNRQIKEAKKNVKRNT